MPFPLLLAGAAMSLGGGIMQGMGAKQGADYQAGLSDFNSRQSMMDAQIARQNSEAQARALRKSGRQLTGKQRVGYAKSGLRLEGTPLEVMAESIENIELDAISTKQQGEFEARQHEVQAEMSSEQAGAQRRAGTLGMISGVLGGATGAMGMFK